MFHAEPQNSGGRQCHAARLEKLQTEASPDSWEGQQLFVEKRRLVELFDE